MVDYYHSIKFNNNNNGSYTVGVAERSVKPLSLRLAWFDSKTAY